VDLGPVISRFPFLASGVAITLAVTAVSLVLALSLGLLIAVLRMSPVRPLSWIATLYIDFFRSTPLFIQLVWFFYVLPILTGFAFPVFATAAIGLGAYSAAYFAEVYRTGILAVPTGQREAALSQGMTSPQALRRVVLPQALRKMLPPATSTLVTHLKDSSLVSVLGLGDLMYQSYSLSALIFRPFEVLTVAAAIYFLMTYPLTVLANRLHRRGLARS
jgi:His/Glu/Gln/Arg/opine family amino acid ABC transporter permease subunit